MIADGTDEPGLRAPHMGRAPAERAAHHAQSVRDHERVARDLVEHAPLAHPQMSWRRERIEGHAVRAIIALLEWAR